MKLTYRSIILLSVWLSFAIADGLLRLYNYQQERNFEATWLADVWQIFAIGLVVVLIWEIRSFKDVSSLKAVRDIAKTLPVNSFFDVKIKLTNSLNRTLSGEVIDHFPEFCSSSNMPVKIKLNPAQLITVEYQLKAHERGDLNMTQCELWLLSELGLLKRRLMVECRSFSKIYPNYRSIMNYTLLATEQKTRQLGIRQRQQRGNGLEFHQLREYRMGDGLRQVDWRATSRLQKLISKDYQQERDQNIIFLLDSGRRMRTKDGKLSHFDQALNATLLVASIALRQGDAVGLKVFGGKDQFLLPKKGPSYINTLLNHVYDVHPANRASDLITAAETLNLQFKKRSLVVIVSNVRSEDEAEIKSAVAALRKHHLVMLANLKEQALQDSLSEPVYQLEGALKYAQTANYLHQREKLQRTLTGQGVIAVDSLPDHLAINMVNQYFDIKKSGRL